MADAARIAALLKALEHPALKTIDLSLDRMQRYCDAYGGPQHRLPPVIHVAGTNGKGSTIAYIRAILEAAGYACHVYTSPHLVRFNERIVIAGREITDAQLLPLLEQVAERTKTYPLTFFEATTAAALEAFAKHPADFTLLEVGMGGRYDATNLVGKPAATVITPVSLDHMEFLGHSLAAIAHEKAGILKSGVPLALGRQKPEAEAAIRQVAEALGVHIHPAGADYQGDLPLQGVHQKANAALALKTIALLREQGVTIPSGIEEQALLNARWPARLQPITHGPLRDALSPTANLWLDGGHNEDAARQIAQWAAGRGKPLFIVCGMVGRKDAVGFLRPFGPLAQAIYGVEIEGEPQSMPLSELKKAGDVIGHSVITGMSLTDSIVDIQKLVGVSGVDVLICGSLYLAGKVLEKNG